MCDCTELKRHLTSYVRPRFYDTLGFLARDEENKLYFFTAEQSISDGMVTITPIASEEWFEYVYSHCIEYAGKTWYHHTEVEKWIERTCRNGLKEFEGDYTFIRMYH